MFPFRTCSLALLAELHYRDGDTYLHTKKVSVGQSAFRDKFAAPCNWSVRIWEEAAILLSLSV